MKHIPLVMLALVALAAQPAWSEDKPASKAPEVAAGKQPSSKGSATAAEANMEILRQKLKSDKRFIVAQNMDLSDAESKAFWPLYDAYQKELEKLNQRTMAVAASYLDAYEKAPISDDLSKKLLSESLEIDKAEVDLKRAHLSKVQKVLHPYKVVRYAQIENKIRALIKYDLAVEIPLAD